MQTQRPNDNDIDILIKLFEQLLNTEQTNVDSADKAAIYAQMKQILDANPILIDQTFSERNVTLMHCAAGWGMFDMVKFLVQYDPNLLLVNCYGQTPAMRARDFAKRNDIADYLDTLKNEKCEQKSISSYSATSKRVGMLKDIFNKEPSSQPITEKFLMDLALQIQKSELKDAADDFLNVTLIVAKLAEGKSNEVTLEQQQKLKAWCTELEKRGKPFQAIIDKFKTILYQIQGTEIQLEPYIYLILP